MFLLREAQELQTRFGESGARNCRVAITFPRKSTNFYPVTCWRAITVALNSNTSVVLAQTMNSDASLHTKFLLKYRKQYVSTKQIGP